MQKITFMRNVIILISIICCCSSCSNNKHADAFSVPINKQIHIPQNVELLCNGEDSDTHDFNQDFTILTYVDAKGCTPCEMKLDEWNDIMDKFQALGDKSVAFLMVVNAPYDSIMPILDNTEYSHLIMCDKDNIFCNQNNLKDFLSYKTFLLDSCFNIISIGDPISYPEIRKIYERTIYDQSSEDIDLSINKVRYIGLMHPEDSINESFMIFNYDNNPISIHNIDVSDSTIVAQIEAKDIDSNKKKALNISLAVKQTGILKKQVTVNFTNDSSTNMIIYGYSN